MNRPAGSLRRHLCSTLLILLCLLGVFPLDVILPSFPALSDEFRVDTKQIAYSVSFFAVGVAMAQIVIGPLSDGIGRKRLLLAGLSVSIVGALGCVFSTQYETFMAFRLVQALGCGSLVLGQALVQDLYSGTQRNAMRILLTSASGLFISLSPLAGAFLQQSFGWKASFTVFVIIAAIVSLLSCVLLHDAPASHDRAPSMSSYRVMLRDTDYLAHAMLSSLAFACHFSFIVIAPLLLMGRLELTAYQFSLVFIGYGLAYIVGGMAATYLNSRVSPQAQIKSRLAAYKYGGHHPFDVGMGGRFICAGCSTADDCLYHRDNPGTPRRNDPGFGALSASGRCGSVAQYDIAVRRCRFDEQCGRRFGKRATGRLGRAVRGGQPVRRVAACMHQGRWNATLLKP